MQQIWRTAALCTLAVLSLGLAGCNDDCGKTFGDNVDSLYLHQGPTPVTVYESQAASFNVQARGSTGTQCQWFRDNVAIEGASATRLDLAKVGLNDDGAQFNIRLRDRGFVRTSGMALLTVLPAAPRISQAPQDAWANAGATAIFSASAEGLPPLRFQWTRNGQDIAGASAISYSIAAASAADHGSRYALRVTNGAGNSVISSEATLRVNLPDASGAPAPLILSEVSGCEYASSGCWVELYNPGTTAIELQHYRLRSSSQNTLNSQPVEEFSYALPPSWIDAGGYLVLSGNGHREVQRGTENLLLIAPTSEVPSWGQSGFIELLSQGKTVDFVRFGDSKVQPVSASPWSAPPAGAAPAAGVAALATVQPGPGFIGQSLVRVFPRTGLDGTHSANPASDWARVRWPTPAGPNDVPATARDKDGDGVPDSAKMPGGRYAGLDLYAMGARPGQRDIFIQLQSMADLNTDQATEGHTKVGLLPREEALQMVTQRFARHGIHLHFDAGQLFSRDFSPERFNLGQRQQRVPAEACVSALPDVCRLNPSDRRTVYHWKAEFMELARRNLFHYVLFAHSLKADGGKGPGGSAEMPGNDMIIAMGSWEMRDSPEPERNRLINYQAGTLMHELGHNLGLDHGGADSVNDKPNYLSVMNYLYQLRGLPENPAGLFADDRWMHKFYPQQSMALSNSALGPPQQFLIDFSNGAGQPLDEARLLEADNIGHGSQYRAFADWDRNGRLSSGWLVQDLNADGAHQRLYDYNDWARLLLPFAHASSEIIRTLKRPRTGTEVAIDGLLNDRQAVAQEEASATRLWPAQQ